MEIVGHRIQSGLKSISRLSAVREFLVVVQTGKIHINRLTEVGLPESSAVGTMFLPSSLGPVSKFNAEGKYVVHKDKPKETAFRQREWSWREFRGRYDSELKSDVVEIPYLRYPRSFIPPPSVELTLRSSSSGEPLLSSPVISLSSCDDLYVTHVINLFLELFGQCEIHDTSLSSVIQMPIRKLNWAVLPTGEYPWEHLKKELEPFLNRQPDGNRAVISKRVETINSFRPEFVAVGRAGFSGYLVFGFPARDIFVLECSEVNNATYVLDKNWEEISALSKAQLLRENLHKHRIVHRKSWFSEIRSILGGDLFSKPPGES